MSEWNRVGVIERARCNVPCDFRDGISRDEFSTIAYNVKKRMTRVRKIEIDETRIRGLAESHSGRSTWWFIVDFNNL